MKTYISDIIPKLKRYSYKLDDITKLTNKHWVVIDDINLSKTVYIFRTNNELLVSEDGNVQKAKWEYIGNNSILIDINDKSLMFRHGFFDTEILALKLDGKNEFAFMIDEPLHENGVQTTEKIESFLHSKYIEVKEEGRPMPPINEAESKEGNAIVIFLMMMIFFGMIGLAIFLG